MRKLLTIALLCLLGFSCQKAENEFQSPNGELTANYDSQGGLAIQYQGGHKTINMMEIPQIGFMTSHNKDSLRTG